MLKSSSNWIDLDSAEGILLQQVHNGLRPVIELEAEAPVDHQAGVEAAGLDGDSGGLTGTKQNEFKKIIVWRGKKLLCLKVKTELNMSNCLMSILKKLFSYHDINKNKNSWN